MPQCFLQDKSLLLAAKTDIAALAKKDSASLLIISDSHGASDILFFILKECGSLCDALIFCGDGLCDLALLAEYCTSDTWLAGSVPPVIAFVQGNNDSPLYSMKALFQNQHGAETYKDKTVIVPKDQLFTAAGHKIFLTHGHNYALYGGTGPLVHEALSQKADLAFYGHTHVASAEYYGHVLVLNPGSCALPRKGQMPCYARVSLKKGSLDFAYTFYALTGIEETSSSVPYNPLA